MKPGCSLLAVVSLLAGAAFGETLRVGPRQKYARPSQAIQAAREGDVVEIDPAGSYGGDVATIRASKLTIRGVGNSRVKLPANGRHEGGKAIWVITGNDVTVENIEFSGARVPDRNGAGIRPEGRNLTVRNCRFYDCEDGILGGVGELVIEYCEFSHCGPVPQPCTHSLYIGHECTKLVFRYNYSTDVIQGYLLKSRARENWVLYNRLTDENGTGSGVAEFPNGGLVVMVGNVLHKGPKAQNSRVIAYGLEGLVGDNHALYVVNNTMLYENRSAGAVFVRAEHTPANFVPVIRNNLCIGSIPLTNVPRADAAGDLMVRTAAEAQVADASRYDFHLRAGSPCVGKGVEPGKVGKLDLTPTFQYLHPCRKATRPAAPRLDVGAYQYSVSGGQLVEGHRGVSEEPAGLPMPDPPLPPSAERWRVFGR